MHQSEPPILAFATQKAWRDWLTDNFEKTEGIYLQIYKKGSGVPTVSYAEALDEALCFGWIDGVKKSYDEKSWLQRFTPRRAKSVWSKVNREHIARLTEAGLMHKAGVAAVDAAKADGRWDAAYDSPSNMQVPLDFQQALDANPKAKTKFDSLNKTNRYSFLYRIHSLKRPENRAKKITDFIDMLNNGE
jgi:uncharacterized protein YdeI (YjbR/CyaY-like superfamily)